MKALVALVFALVVEAWSPTDSYAPGEVRCPSYLEDESHNTDTHQGFVRSAQGLSRSESAWMEGRDEVTNENLRSYLLLANMTDFDTDDFMDELEELSGSNSSVRATPRVALAFSGGGYRAMLCAAGEISGLDDRTRGAQDHGVPILPAVSYIAGLSGGSWFLSSLAFNNWTSVQSIVDNVDEDDHIWDLEHNILNPGGINVFETANYWDDIDDDLDDKRDAGFNISMTDPWGRALSHQFFPGLHDEGASMTFSSLRNFPVFSNHSMPFPLVIADGRRPGTTVINLNSTVFEFNPFEMGSWDPSVYSFADLQYVGTDIEAGMPAGNGTCIAGFDNTGYVFGTSSTLFNQFILQLNTTGISGVLYDLVEDVLEHLGNEEDDIAEWRPNPFYQCPWSNSNSIRHSRALYLVDGGEDNQNIPLYPLLQPERNVDVIFAFDNSFDTDSRWPNGAAMVASYERQRGTQSNGTAFPYVPNTETFLVDNLTAKPAFFGCYSENLTSLMDEMDTDYTPPLIVYTANRPYTYNSNTSTYQMSYDTDEMLDMIQNGFAVSTRDNLTACPLWRACVGCAILQRSRERLGLEMGEQCQRCFDEYCWDGTITNETRMPNTFDQSGMYYEEGNEGTVTSDGFSTSATASSSEGESTATGSAIVAGAERVIPAQSSFWSALLGVLLILM